MAMVEGAMNCAESRSAASAPNAAGPEPRLLVETQGAVVVWTLNRPDKMNALDAAMVEALHAACAEVERAVSDCGPEIGAVVVQGSGARAFAAGADIAELRERRAADALAAINSRLFDRVASLPVPAIAAVRGFALGGGCELALACDLRVAGASARFGQPEVTLGIMAAAGGTYRLPSLVGLGRARELLFTGRLVDSSEALRIGLCEHVVADDAVLDFALDLAQRIAGNDGLAVRTTKAALARVSHGGGELVAAESRSQAVLFESPGKFARMDAFLAKRARQSTGSKGDNG